ncbi:hypothetical protein HGRIS_010826 [Hohenbuehelia grisea]|uniref:EamA domain-containing protein n=1 Tax=Hohenbuehelia grisea TaxID=104357 RepID=A0ABR3IXZ0_9AGAR
MTLRHDTDYTPIRRSFDIAQEPDTGDVDADLPESHLCRSAFTRLKSGFERNTGLFLVIGSQAFLAFMNVAVKKLNSLDPPVPPLELIAVRMAITYVCCMAYMLIRNVDDPWIGPKGVRLLLVFRGFTGFFGLFGVYYSLQYLSLSDATVLTFLSPLCTAIAGSLLLGEKFHRREVFAGLFSLFGVVLIARPEFIFGSASHSSMPGGNGHLDGSESATPAQRLGAVGVALLGVLGATGAYTTLRAIGKRAHPMHSMTSFSAQCIIVSSIGMTVNKTQVVVPTRLEWLALLLMIGLFGFIAQTLLTMGLQRETAGRGAMAIYTQVIFAGILERIFFHSEASILSGMGTFIIIASALYVALTKESESGSKGKPIVLEHLNEARLEEGLLQGQPTSDEREALPRIVTSPSMKRASPREIESSSSDGIETQEILDDMPSTIHRDS